MPKEFLTYRNREEIYLTCPKCQEPFEHFLRGLVQSFFRQITFRPYVAIICRSCKEIIGWE